MVNCKSAVVVQLVVWAFHIKEQGVVKNQFGLARRSLPVNVHDTTDPQPKYQLSFIVDSHTNADEMHLPYTKHFLQNIA
jgi:hypothetical protein